MARSIAILFWVSATIFAHLQGIECATVEIVNQCSYTVWGAAIPGGGRQLEQGQSWSIQVPAGTKGARVWGRTGCSFDGSGRGKCTTGDCGGVLDCQASGQVPTTLAEYSLNQDQNMDFVDISLVDGFNLPLSMTPSSPGASAKCRRITCLNNVNNACPNELRVTDGCNSACVQFNTPEYCCTGAYLDNCSPNKYSKIFKDQCPDAYSYAKDDPSSTFTCPGGTNYKVVFCG